VEDYARGEAEVPPVKCLDETPKEIAARMRGVAEGMTNPVDVEAIRRYADWVETHPDADEVKDLVKLDTD
jgi:hypothetical protein